MYIIKSYSLTLPKAKELSLSGYEDQRLLKDYLLKKGSVQIQQKFESLDEALKEFARYSESDVIRGVNSLCSLHTLTEENKGKDPVILHTSKFKFSDIAEKVKI